MGYLRATLSYVSIHFQTKRILESLNQDKVRKKKPNDLI